MLSLNHRLLLVGSLVLAGFMGATGVVLDTAFRQAATEARQERLQGEIYTLLAAADMVDGKLQLPEALTQPKLMNPSSGLYAVILDLQGGEVWKSPSLLTEEFRPSVQLEPGQQHTVEGRLGGHTDYFALAYGVAWADASGRTQQFHFIVAEDIKPYRQQIEAYRKSLWGWLIGAAVVLLFAQGVVLRWSLAPLRRVESELLEIEAGRTDHLSGDYPRELKGMTRNLNVLISNERSRMEHYRNTLSNLAHSLKTPLAVLRSMIENAPEDERQVVQVEQLERIDSMVEYQLSRAASSGKATFAAPINVTPIIQKLVRTLQKVHVDKAVEASLKLGQEVYMPGTEGDLMELFGNLLENAWKWSRNNVQVELREVESDQSRRPGLIFSVEDDGPGIPEEEVQRVLKRGERADSNTPGHGIGLAIVVDLVKAYHGELNIGRSSLGGARMEVVIPPQ